MSRFVRACALAEVAAESALAVEVDNADIAIVQSEGRFYAIADECSHASIPLSEGDVGNGEVECYLHGSRFDLRTGRPTGLPATEPVKVYPCIVSGDDVLVDVSSPIDPDAAVDADNPQLVPASTETQES
ncbi:non-heme iron oxygenase ferredoxin subunit [Microlunatus panaciterrae]|uniref:3-phenylpropionate/trans-cinnamate dioxygenase ferredoxin subunit n=1 Tax=Microlunatus panaciterrae TaxID=400768 RepID=A0ABS2RMN2_9ACTN|nr:non-heme iron oxygenase ferredoxin subunit [Microlunatus panaciterrae]MBM7800260.1 3-phenylpropionate/trans-cinnamate dioxygenase ferredoxin subunit [Microlunatus panaciterrae]